MIDANEAEIAAMIAASERAGEFIESVPSTDMAAWTEEQWHQFIEVICTGYVESLGEQMATINAAFAKARGE